MAEDAEHISATGSDCGMTCGSARGQRGSTSTHARVPIRPRSTSPLILSRQFPRRDLHRDDVGDRTLPNESPEGAPVTGTRTAANKKNALTRHRSSPADASVSDLCVEFLDDDDIHLGVTSCGRQSQSVSHPGPRSDPILLSEELQVAVVSQQSKF